MAAPRKTPLELFNLGAAKYDASTAGLTRELARYLIDISPPLSAKSHVLDNACGTGYVAQEVLLNRFAAREAQPRIACVDGAPAMVDIARNSFQSLVSKRKAQTSDSVSVDADSITFEVMNGQDLQFPSEHFTHSITNQGILFFMDPAKGASEIYRTLKTGGTAIVTSWVDLGHVTVVQEAQKASNPDAPLMRFPIPPQWNQASHLENTLRDAGFADVKVHEKVVYYAVGTIDELCTLLLDMHANFSPGWNESDNAELQKHLRVAIENAAVKIERVVAGETPDKTEQLVGLPSIALVAVAKK
jgi:ubiquinone/menaquinone biosynthesis C-methylase UbiE